MQTLRTPDHRLFHPLVTAALALVPACAGPASPSTTQRATEPEVTTEDAPVTAATTPDPAPGAEDSPAPEPTRIADACECVGEGVTCEANGVACCWAHHECCEPCCPSPT